MAAYIVITRSRTRDGVKFDLYAKGAPAFMAGHAVNFLTRFGPCEEVEGVRIEAVAILEFSTLAEAMARYAGLARKRDWRYLRRRLVGSSLPAQPVR